LRQRNLRLVRRSAAVVIAVLLLGCEASSPPPGSSSPAPSQAPAATASPSLADMRAAKAAILRLADVGPGFKQTPYQPTAQARSDDAALNRCIGRPPSVVHQTAEVFSMQFSRGDSQIILASITFVDSPQTAQQDVAALRGARARACVKNSLLVQYRRTDKQATASIGPLRPSPTGTAPSANYRIKVLAQISDGTLPVLVDLAQATKGRAEVSAEFMDVNQPVPASLELRAMTVMLDRL
jgi:hypothetical protein